MSLRDSRDNAIIALRFWDDAVDRADDDAERDQANGHDARAEPAPVVIDPNRKPLMGG